MSKNPETDGLFVFVNKRGNRLKAMWWDRTGYALLPLSPALLRTPDTRPKFPEKTC